MQTTLYSIRKPFWGDRVFLNTSSNQTTTTLLEQDYSCMTAVYLVQQNQSRSVHEYKLHHLVVFLD